MSTEGCCLRGTLQERGQLFVSPGVECYEGMLVGERSEPGDMVVNIARKSLGNQRVFNCRQRFS